jgi:hypothetical protein
LAGAIVATSGTSVLSLVGSAVVLAISYLIFHSAFYAFDLYQGRILDLDQNGKPVPRRRPASLMEFWNGIPTPPIVALTRQSNSRSTNSLSDERTE